MGALVALIMIYATMLLLSAQPIRKILYSFSVLNAELLCR
jgi:hypothetical protein